MFSASSNLAYLYGNGETLPFLVRHFMHLVLGFAIIYGVHKVPAHYFKGLSIIGVPIVIILLLITMAQGTTIDGANASRWIKVPFVGITFQTSTLASVVGAAALPSPALALASLTPARSAYLTNSPGQARRK